MKTNLAGWLGRGALTALLAALVNTMPTRAAVITYAGAMNDFGPHWRTASVSKPLDLDGDYVLGTDGYFVVNRPVVQPNYVSAMMIITNTYPGNANYAQVDDPTSPGQLLTSGTLNPFPGSLVTFITTNHNSEIIYPAPALAQFTLNTNAVGRTIRVGLMLDNLDSTNYNNIAVWFTDSPGFGTAGFLELTNVLSNDRIPDWIFMDIQGAAAGNTFIVYGYGGFAGAATLGGITFDSLAGYVVSNTNDAGTGSLRVMTMAAPPGTTLTFDPSLSGATISLTNGEILLGKNLTIDASALPGGIAINGRANSRIFEVASGATVTLAALTLTNGLAVSGGAILSAGNLTINRCSLTGNAVSAGGAGGGIYNNLGALTLNECTVAGNSASLGGGAGGGIFNLTVGAPVILNQCTVSGNVANSGGGLASVPFLFNGTNNVTFFNSIVAGNSAGSQPDITTNTTPVLAGTNLVGGSPLLFPLANYGGPTPTMPPMPGSPAMDAGSDSATNTFATDQRGLPRLAGAHVDIGAAEPQVLVVSNNADTGPGSLRSAVATSSYASSITFDPGLAGQTIQFSNGVILITHTLGIDASALPGGITLDGRNASRIFDVESGTVVLNELTLTHGQAGAGSGGVIYNADILTLNACTLAGNSAANGGAVDNLGRLTLNACTLAGNSVNGSGGFTAPGGGILNFGTLTLNECTLANNVAANGGAIYNGNSLALNQCTLTANLANGGSGGGGAVYNASTLTVSNSIVAGNNQSIGTDIYGPVTYSGVNLTTGDPQLAPLGNYGGPTPTMPPLPASPVIDACTNGTSFVTDQRGFQRVVGPFMDIGAVEFQDASPIVTTYLDAGVGSLRYALNYAPNGSLITFDSGLSGASILVTNGEIMLTKNLTVDASSLPGGITINGNHSSRAFEVVSNVTVVLNALAITNGWQIPTNVDSPLNTYIGGGILNAGNLTVNQCTLAGNSARYGGGIFNEGGHLTMNHCVLLGNSAIFEGGGILNSGPGQLVIDDSTIAACSCAGSGGGIKNYGSLAVNRCTLSGNSVTNGAGGGIFTVGSASLANSTIMANGANEGGGIYNHGLVTLRQCTLAGNAGTIRGGGICNFGSQIGGADALVALNQCTLTANTSSGSGGGICNLSTLTMTNSIVAGNNAVTASDIYGAAIYGGANLTNGNPLLEPLANYGGPTQTTPPLPGSPAIDAGSDFATNSFTTDQRGLPRLTGGHVDIGAVEGVYNPAGPGRLTGMNRAANGAASFTFTNFTDMSFTVLATTNVAWPLNLWSNLGGAVETPAGSGHYQFTDQSATNRPQRFYRVSSP